MREQINRLMAIDSNDEDIRRRGFNVVALGLGLSLLALLFMPQTLLQPNKASVAAIVVSLVIYALTIVLARRGRVTPAAWILTISITVAVIGVILSGGMITASPFYLLLSVLIASLVLRPGEIWLVLGINVAALAVSLNLLPSALLSDPRDSQALISVFALLAVITLIGFLGARSTATALRAAQHARAETEAAAALERVNGQLETKIAARTTELAEALEAQRAQATELQASLATQQSLNETLNAMSLPIIPVRADLLVAPLVGNMAGSRA